MSAAPTPGPWALAGEAAHGAEVRGPSGISVAWCGMASVHGDTGSHYIGAPEAAANARLIAAAPDLVKALRELLAETMTRDGGICIQCAERVGTDPEAPVGSHMEWCRVAQARAAIAKATGIEP